MGDNEFDGGRYPEWLNDVAKKVDELIMQPPILQRYRQQVLDWAETRSRKLEAIHSWEEAREAHRFRILTDAQLQNEEADPPEPGWEFEFYPKWGAYAKACRVVDRKEIEVRYTVNEGN